MQVFHTIAELRRYRKGIGDVAFVPTMGALHAGHLSLVDVALKHAKKVCVSIFVNPTQFGPHEDFHKYPRPIEKDLLLCEKAGVDFVFNPSPEEMYGAEMYRSEGRANDTDLTESTHFSTRNSQLVTRHAPLATRHAQVLVDLPELTNVLDGVHRPGHFQGVCQVVAKLFNIVQPQYACFGRKDFQQLRVLTAMVEALDFPIEMVPCETLRDPDGLAMSSRNAYLSAEARKRALCISRGLFRAVDLVKQGERDAGKLVKMIKDEIEAQQMKIDYVAAIDSRTLASVTKIEKPTTIAIAARVDTTRLIDNVEVNSRE